MKRGCEVGAQQESPGMRAQRMQTLTFGNGANQSIKRRGRITLSSSSACRSIRALRDFRAIPAAAERLDECHGVDYTAAEDIHGG